MENYLKKIEDLKKTFEKRNLKYIHYNSVYNFISHIDEIRNERYQKEVIKQLDTYFKFFEEQFILSKSESNQLYIECVQKMGDYFSVELNFKLYSNLKYELFFSTIADCLFISLGLYKRIYHLPIFSIIIIARYLYLIKFKKQKKLYGYQY